MTTQPPPVTFMPNPTMYPQQQVVVPLPDPLERVKTCSRCYALVHDDFQFQHQGWHDSEDAWAEPQPEE